MADGHSCTVCSKAGKVVTHSFRLTRDKSGEWQTNPVCGDCRRRLIQQAVTEGRFVPFFSLEASQKEAQKRNEERKINRPFLEKFGRPQEKEAKAARAKKPEKPKAFYFPGR